MKGIKRLVFGSIIILSVIVGVDRLIWVNHDAEVFASLNITEAHTLHLCLESNEPLVAEFKVNSTGDVSLRCATALKWSRMPLFPFFDSYQNVQLPKSLRSVLN